MAQKHRNERDVPVDNIFKYSMKSDDNGNQSKDINAKLNNRKAKRKRNKPTKTNRPNKINQLTNVGAHSIEEELLENKESVEDLTTCPSSVRSNNQSRGKETFWNYCDFMRQYLDFSVSNAGLHDGGGGGQSELVGSVAPSSRTSTDGVTASSSKEMMNVTNRIMSTKLFRAVRNSQHSKVGLTLCVVYCLDRDAEDPHSPMQVM